MSHMDLCELLEAEYHSMLFAARQGQKGDSQIVACCQNIYYQIKGRGDMLKDSPQPLRHLLASIYATVDIELLRREHPQVREQSENLKLAMSEAAYYSHVFR